eukprot:9411416-Lingulodinium_polyedra.AAC.1
MLVAPIQGQVPLSLFSQVSFLTSLFTSFCTHGGFTLSHTDQVQDFSTIGFSQNRTLSLGIY